MQGYKDSYSARHGRWVGIDISPSPDYAMLAQSCRAYAETVSEPVEVEPALRRALAAVERGQAAVLDVLIERP